MTTPLPILARCSGETPGGPCRLGKDGAPPVARMIKRRKLLGYRASRIQTTQS